LAAAVVVLSALTDDTQNGLATNVPWVVIALAFAVVGVVVARRQPHNSMGWLLLAVALVLILSYVGTTYSVIDYRVHHGSLPFGLVAVCLGELWVTAIMLIALPVLLFPSGHLPSRKWRATLWAYLLSAGTVLIGEVLSGLGAGMGRGITIALAGTPNTNHLPAAIALAANVLSAPVVIGAVLWLVWIVRLLASYRRSTGVLRQQLKWLLGGTCLTMIAVTALTTVALVTSGGQGPSGLVQLLVYVVLSLGVSALPIGLGVGILKYRLYDVDRLISRTLSYGIVTGLLIGVYLGLVTLATRVLPFSSPIGVAASTLAAVALFNPLRRRVQRLVDRRFNRARYDAEETVAAFAHRVRDDVELEAVSTEFVRAVQTAVEPAHVSLWLRPTRSIR
jgi:hypothetical protein